MKKALIIILFLILAGTLVVKIYLPSLSYSIDSNKVSPNGHFSVTEFYSNSEGGHAPYGQHLVLSREKIIRHPDEGHLIFAGYCSKLNYEWNQVNNITISCHSRENAQIMAQSVMVYGIEIDLQMIVEKPHNKSLKDGLREELRAP